MPKLLVFQHVAHEVLGTLDPLCRSAGFRIRYVNFGRDPQAAPGLDRQDGLIVLGGPMNVGDSERYPHLRTEKKLILEAIERQIPVLGICLGAQLIARALGAEVRANERREIGWYDVSLTSDGSRDPLLESFSPLQKVFQWHGDTFGIPQGAVHLASSEDCRNQAFRYGENVYGLQFHLEVDRPMVERWLEVPENQREIESLNGQIDPQAIRQQTRSHIRDLMSLSDQTFSRFLGLFGKVRRRSRHPHR